MQKRRRDFRKVPAVNAAARRGLWVWSFWARGNLDEIGDDVDVLAPRSAAHSGWGRTAQV